MKKSEKKNGKENEKNVLPFPVPPEKPAVSPMIFQIGRERFAIHWEIEDLPPVKPVLRWKAPSRKVKPIQ